MTAEQVAARFGCSVAQARAQYAKNARQLRECARIAAEHPAGTYRGFTAAQWDEKAGAFEQRAK